MRHLFCVMLLSLILALIGCSSGSKNPTTPGDQSASLSELTPGANSDSEGRSLIGMWDLKLDPVQLACEITPYRETEFHINAKSFVPPPYIQVNSYDPGTETIDVTVTLANPYQVPVYDVRLIIYSDDIGHELLNADNWTGLYDIPGGDPINPFRAYRKDAPVRRFDAQSQYSENLLIKLPGGDPNVKFAIDVSVDLNCEEPYMIDNFQHGYLADTQGKSCKMKVNVFDWQNNVYRVALLCPAVTGVPEKFLSYDSDNLWRLNLKNETGAAVGDYPGVIRAVSENSTYNLYQKVNIHVSTSENVPFEPQLDARLMYLWNTIRVKVQGNYAYILDSATGFSIADISVPWYPWITGNYSIYANELEVNGNYAYVGIHRDGVRIFDVSNPYIPSLVKSITELDTHVLALGANRLYVWSENPNYLYVIDVTNPLDPIIKSQTSGLGVDGMALRNQYLYLIDSNAGFKILDITNDLSPQTVGSLPETKGLKIALDGDYAYILGYEGQMKIINIQDYQNPLEVGPGLTLGDGNQISINNGYAYVTGGSGSSNVVDVSDPETPSIVHTFKNCYGQDIAISNNCLYMADGTCGFKIFDLSTNPMYPFEVGHIVQLDAQGIDVQDNNAFVVAPYGGLLIYDMTNPKTPFLRKQFDLDGACDVDVPGNYAYITRRDKGFSIVDVSNVLNPIVMNPDNSLMGHEVIVRGNVAWIAGLYSDGLKAVDITNPSNPHVIGQAPGFIIEKMVIQNNFAYVAENGSGVLRGLIIIDISDPTNPFITGYNTPRNAHGIDVQGNYAYLSDFDSSIITYDISDQYDPQLIGRSEESGYGCLLVEGNFAYLGYSGLRVMDISNPDYPNEFIDVYFQYSPLDMVRSNNYIYAATGEGGLAIIRLWD